MSQLEYTRYIMDIKRDIYLNKLISKKHNHLIKIVTGIRRCGKSYLLFSIFYRHLLNEGIKEDHIIRIALDDFENRKLRDPETLYNNVKNKIIDNDMYYLLLDEIQMVKEFEDVLNGFLHIENVDVYVTGSNAKFLSKDIITEFRGRGDQIHMYPLSFMELSSFYNDLDEAYNDYSLYGGLPLILAFKDHVQKREYLESIIDETYLNDIVNRNKIRNTAELNDLLFYLASSIGTLVNPRKLANTFKSVKGKTISQNTISKYLSYFEDSFLTEKALRYDIKGKRYINSPIKYYFTDLGLRNAKLNFRQIEEPHIMENIIYNELKYRGYGIDVGNITVLDKNKSLNNVYKTVEIDFVCNKGNERLYIQSAYSLPVEEKKIQEERPLLNIDDSFKKIIITKDNILPKQDDRGIITVNLYDFLLNRVNI